MALSACSAPGSMLDTHGPKAEQTATLWWLMLGAALAVFLLVMLLLGLALLRQRRPPAVDERGLARVGRLGRFGANALVVVFGLAVPSVVLVATLVWDVRTLAALAGPPAPARLTISVTGHQFWWEFRYAEADVASPSELHVPAGEPVLLEIRGADVIHSFWVPQLMGKLDAIPGQTNTTWLQADTPGTFRGQCAEFCGEQHAHMGFLVIAEPADEFAAWLDAQGRPAAPSDPSTAPGAQLFARAGCIACHTIRYGTTGVGGQLGPDLTHVGGRRTLASNTLDNTLGNMEGWIGNPQAIRPGTLMPAVPLDADELRALAVYLESLK
jgi:cytochrome c oxidase subunit II